MEKRIIELLADIALLEEQERKAWQAVQDARKPYEEANSKWSNIWVQVHHAKIELQVLQEVRDQQEKGN